MRSRKSTRKLKTQVIESKVMSNAIERRTPKRFNVYGVKGNSRLMQFIWAWTPATANATHAAPGNPFAI